jgi:glycosyltransferase involved in cell wall biosynthesis
MNSAIAQPVGPIVYIKAGNGSRHSQDGAANLVRELSRVTDVVSLELCGDGNGHKMNLDDGGPGSFPPFPKQPYMTAASGVVESPGLAKGTLAVPYAAKVVAHLQRALREIHPRALCVADEQALFVASLAMPAGLPLAYLVTSDLRSIRSDCAPAWCRVDAALGVSEHSLRYLRSTHYAHRNLHVIGSGIDIERTLAHVGAYQANAASSTAPLPLRVLSPVSSPRPLKGHRESMQAIGSLNQRGVPTELWLCTQECRFAHSSRARIVELAAGVGVQEHVRTWDRRQRFAPAMARSDIALFLASDQEPPQRLLEAMALGKPIVATRAGSAPELVREGIDGILVDPGDVRAAVEALETLSDPLLRERMGAAGQYRARNEFSPAGQANRALAAIDALAEPMRFGRDWLLNTSYP